MTPTLQQTPIPPKTEDGNRPDYKLLIQNLERQVLCGQASQETLLLLSRQDIWQALDASDACRWSRMAQIAGLADMSLDILEGVNRSSPQYEPAWLERIELLGLMDRREELVRVRAQAMASHNSPGIQEALRESSIFLAVPSRAHPNAADMEMRTEGLETPFVELRREEEDIGLFMSLFSGREEAFARQWIDRNQQTSGYAPVRRPMQQNDIREHFAGRQTYGIYLLRNDNTVRLGVIDVDLHKKYRDRVLTGEEKQKVRTDGRYLLKRLMELSSQVFMPFVLEYSGGKGYHLWYLLETPLPATTVRKAIESLTQQVSGDVESFHLEVFPKQDSLSAKGFGNLVKLPLGIHRKTGKPSYFILAKNRSLRMQMDYLRGVRRIPNPIVEKLAASKQTPKILMHPHQEAWTKEYPELGELEIHCPLMRQIFSDCRDARSLSVREEKILLCTLGHLPRARHLLHYLFGMLPEYNRHLVDYKISAIRGTPLGCKRIHRLLGDGEEVLPCRFEAGTYQHPLLHLKSWQETEPLPISEKVSNLQDALESLSLALKQAQHFLGRAGD